ncbi:hypothetical protein C2S53_011523 [Perilla frutescens var. hirtella]|uniref:KIB1-4 beta-propeller domain-containing protein n=1 Tax=Perilla frutescens var. hirtella TaxID=608512 RepID=A0AAD4P705_PERFH|nr:hypothetical protein C2S53_011523 [Perilla frutescens var. hirtella]
MGCSPLMLSNSYYRMSQKNEAMLVGSSHGWLALFNELSRDFFLWNPISGRRINLPPIDTLPIPAVNLKGGYGCVDKVIISSLMEFYCCMHVLLLHFRIAAIIHVINPKWQLVLPLCRTTTTTIHLPAHLPPGNDRDRSCKKPRIE